MTLGKVGAPNAAVYTASKHAVEGLTKAAALEGAETGVRVNAVAPGPVETEMLNRFTGAARVKRTSSRASRSNAPPLLKKSPTPSFSLPAKRRFLPASRSSSMGSRLPLSGQAFPVSNAESCSGRGKNASLYLAWTTEVGLGAAEV